MFQLEPKHDAPQRWNRWIDRFDNYILATAIDEPIRMEAGGPVEVWWNTREVKTAFQSYGRKKIRSNVQQLVHINLLKKSVSTKILKINNLIVNQRVHQLRVVKSATSVGTAGLTPGSHCPAYGKTCSKCGQHNHFAAQCRNAVKKKTKFFKTLEEEHASHASEYSLEEFGIGEMFHMAIEDESETKVYNCDTLINGVKTVFEIDMGASTTIINESEYQKLSPSKDKPGLQKSDILLKTYTREIVKPAGCAMVSVVYNGDQQNTGGVLT